MSGQEKDYQAVRQWQEAMKTGVQALPEAGSSRAEMVLALAETAAQASRQGRAEGWKAEDYDALYALLEKYRDELRGLGFNQAETDSQLAALKAREGQLEEEIKSLGKYSDGMKITGDVGFVFDNLMTSGPGSPLLPSNPNPGGQGTPAASSGDPLLYRTAKMNTNLMFSATRGPASAQAELAFEYYFNGNGSPYPGSRYLGLRQLKGELRTPVAFQFADLDGKLTPLTLWRNEDEEPFEPELFRAVRQQLRNDLRLKPDAVALRGLRVLTDLLFFKSQLVHVQAMLVPMGGGNQLLYYMGEFPQYPSDPGQKQQQYPYLNNALENGYFSSYLGAWQVALPLFGFWDLAYQGTEILDYPYSSGATPPVYNANNAPDPSMVGQGVRSYVSQVHSGSAAVKWGPLNLDLEVAESLYSNPNHPARFLDIDSGISGYLLGMAKVLHAGWASGWANFDLTTRQVDSNFISAPAQGRSQDAQTSNYGPFLHENSQWNPVNGLYINNFFSFPDPGEDQFTRVFLPPQLMTSPNPKAPVPANLFFFNYLLPYNAAVNASSPYGLATPNRMGAQAKASFNFLGGSLKPSVMADLSQQIVGDLAGSTRAAEQYRVLRLGCEADLEPLLGWPVELTAGWTSQGIDNADWIHFSSTLLEAGAGYHFLKKVFLNAGFRRLSYSGTLAYPLYGGYGDPITGSLVTLNSALQPITGSFTYQQSYSQWGLGLVVAVGENVDLGLQYSNQIFWDALAEGAGIANHYGLEQTAAHVNFRF